MKNTHGNTVHTQELSDRLKVPSGFRLIIEYIPGHNLGNDLYSQDFLSVTVEAQDSLGRLQANSSTRPGGPITDEMVGTIQEEIDEFLKKMPEHICRFYKEER